MEEKEKIELLIEGGKASPGPSSTVKLAAHKLNIGNVFKDINEKTKEYADMKVPVKILIDKKTKEYEIVVGTPPVSSLIKKELKCKNMRIVTGIRPTGQLHIGNYLNTVKQYIELQEKNECIFKIRGTRNCRTGLICKKVGGSDD